MFLLVVFLLIYGLLLYFNHIIHAIVLFMLYIYMKFKVLFEIIEVVNKAFHEIE